MPKDQHEICALLQTKFGFEEEAGAHAWFTLELPGLPSIKTHRSRSKKAGKGLESKMARQVRVRTGFFREMIGCTKSKAEYEQKVREDPYPPWDVRF